MATFVWGILFWVWDQQYVSGIPDRSERFPSVEVGLTLVLSVKTLGTTTMKFNLNACLGQAIYFFPSLSMQSGLVLLLWIWALWGRLREQAACWFCLSVSMPSFSCITVVHQHPKSMSYLVSSINAFLKYLPGNFQTLRRICISFLNVWAREMESKSFARPRPLFYCKRFNGFGFAWSYDCVCLLNYGWCSTQGDSRIGVALFLNVCSVMALQHCL